MPMTAATAHQHIQAAERGDLRALAAVLRALVDREVGIASPAAYSETPADISAALVEAGLMEPSP